DFVGNDIGQMRFRNGANDLEQVNAALSQRIGRQRLPWPQRERIAQFRVDELDGAHGWRPRPSEVGRNRKVAIASRQAPKTPGPRSRTPPAPGLAALMNRNARTLLAKDGLFSRATCDSQDYLSSYCGLLLALPESLHVAA